MIIFINTWLIAFLILWFNNSRLMMIYCMHFLFPSPVEFDQTVSHLYWLWSLTQSFPETTLQEAMREVHRLRDCFQEQETRKDMVCCENFLMATQDRYTFPIQISWHIAQHAIISGFVVGVTLIFRRTKAPEKGYGSILPHHKPEHSMRLEQIKATILSVLYLSNNCCRIEWEWNKLCINQIHVCRQQLVTKIVIKVVQGLPQEKK